MRQSLRAAFVTGRRKMTPDDAGVLRLASNIGYGLPESLSDLIDNSIDAGAHNVLIRVYSEADRLRRIAVVDNGAGMTREELHEAMRLGRSGKDKRQLGMYGIGLKAASLSHTSSLTVVSRNAAETSAVRYTTRGIQEGWKLDELDDDAAAEVMDQTWIPGLSTVRSGTVVMWDEMASFASAGGSATRRFGQLGRHLSQHLGLHFQRFLENDLSIALDLYDDATNTAGLARTVEPLDPFPPHSGDRGYPTTFHATFARAPELGLAAHVWPANSRALGYKLDGRAAQRQGFYFYRNDRLIQAGGWNGWRNNDAEPHLSLARVLVDLPRDSDQAFGVNAQKNGVVVPPDFVEGVTAARAGNTSMADYIRVADDVYRSADAGRHRDAKAIPGSGLSTRLRQELHSALIADDAASAPIALRWVVLPEDRVFEINPHEDEILLNQNHRSLLSGHDGRNARTDAPIFKTLIFLLAGEDALRTRMTKKVLERHQEFNRCLLAALDDA